MFADLHIHMLLSGTDWKAAIAGHQPEPDDILIRNRLSAYKSASISYLRDGGDRFGVCLRARELAPEYGITYRTPAFPIYKRATTAASSAGDGQISRNTAHYWPRQRRRVRTSSS